MSAISSMMKTQVWSVGMDDTVHEVEEFMNSHGLSWVPVCEPGGAVVGVVSVADLLQFHVRRQDPAATRTWQVCTYKPISVAPDTSVSEVARLMLRNRSHHVVVMDQGRIVGVVSSLDFVRQLA
ncbi:MAG: CBS domain-containing protein [Burkholderiaceae bacterium]